MFSLARPLIKPAVKALETAGLSFGAEKALKTIFGNGYGPREIKLYNLVQAMSPQQKKAVSNYLVGKGMVRGGGTTQYGGFLGMLASTGVPIAINLLERVFGKGLHLSGAQRPRPRRSPHPPPPPPPPTREGRGIHIQPPPFIGSWDDYYLKKKAVGF